MKVIGPHGEIEVTIPTHTNLDIFNDGIATISQVGDSTDVHLARDGLNVWVSWSGYTAMFSPPTIDAVAGKTELRASMTGKVVSITVSVGDAVKEGQTVAILEAMKMEYRLEAEIEGKVVEIGAVEGDLVDLGQLIVRLE